MSHILQKYFPSLAFGFEINLIIKYYMENSLTRRIKLLRGKYINGIFLFDLSLANFHVFFVKLINPLENQELPNMFD
jgi:hypothetical protein